MKFKIYLLSFLLFTSSCTLYTGNEEKTKISQPIEKQREKIKEIKNIMDFAKKVPENEFNFPEKITIPRPGGKIKLRMSTDARMLNRILSNEANSSEILGYLFDSMINRDPETFEWLPWIAYAWEVKDRGFIGKKIIEGYYDSTSSLFYEGQGEVTALKTDFKAEGKNLYSLKGKTIHGKKEEIHSTAKIIPNQGKGIKVDKVEKSMVYLFYLRNDVYWHDGKRMIPEDILFSYQMIMNPYTDAAHLRNYYQGIRKVSKINDNTVEFVYEKPYFQSLSLCGGLPILPKHRYNPEKFKGDEKGLGDYFNRHPDNWKPVGNGPFVFDEWKKGERFTLKKNKNYWASKANLPYFKKEQPYLDEIQFVIINNTNAAVKELMNGNIDAIFELEQSLWYDSRLLAKLFTDRFARADFLTPLYTYIGWNLERTLFKDYRVRQALSCLIPKEKILKEIHQNLGEVVSGPFFVKGPVYDHSLTPYPYDPMKARELLKEAGWIDHDGDGIRDKDGVKFEFEYLIHNGREYHQKIADIMKESMEEAGIIMNIRIIDWTIFSKTVSDRNFDSVRFAWGTGIDGDEYQVWHSSQIEQGGSNFIGFKNKRVDEILEQARVEFDPIKRWMLYREMHHILHKLQPYSFLFSFQTLGLYNRKFRGVKFYSGGYNLNEWYIEKE
ncbi:MAG: hypothetical protein A2Y41_14290 [Spirochaetes bacterium GWB1_36_13]|nr:MAG: hypothetical protein A2Y41_14290 [Spirochaetes bacterium GWB1_36_13]